MKATHIIFILTSMIYIEGSYEHTEHKLTDIPSRSESNRILYGTTVGKGEYAYIAEIYLTPFIKDINAVNEIIGRGVLIAPQWVVTVAHPFDEVLKTIEKRKKFSNFIWEFVPLKGARHIPSVRVTIFRIKQDSDHWLAYNKIYFPDRYDPRYVTDDAVDVALIKLVEPVPKHIVSPPSRIDAYLLPDGSSMYPVVQDCWTVSEGTFLNTNDWSLKKMKVIVGNRQYCTALEKKLHPKNPQVTYKNEEYFCAKANDSVNPGARACNEKHDRGAAVMCGNRLLGLLSRRHALGDCDENNAGKNAYGEYVYLGHRYVYNWIRGIVTGKIQPDMRKMYRSDESASGLVEASKIVTWLLTVISVAVALNTYY